MYIYIYNYSINRYTLIFIQIFDTVIYNNYMPIGADIGELNGKQQIRFPDNDNNRDYQNITYVVSQNITP